MTWCLSTWQGEEVRVERLEAREVTLPLRQPLVTARGRYEARRLVVLACDLQVGRQRVRGFGEAAPLPGWTAESVEDCLAGARDFKPGSARSVMESLQGVPALYAAMEMALLDGVARAKEQPLRELLVKLDGGEVAGVEEIALQATLGSAGVDETLRHLAGLVDQGWTTVKLKVGVMCVEEDLERIGEVCRAFPELTLRVDANGAWEVDQARRFLAGAAGLDLVEQPVTPTDRAALVELARWSPLSIAADESVVDAAEGRRLIDDGLDALVLKPGALGGIWATRQLMKHCLARGRRVVLSNLIESALGRGAVAELAASLPAASGPHGLATGAWLAEDFGEGEDVIEGGYLRLGEGPGIDVVPEVFGGGHR